jgi:hypothetical protein
LRAALTARPAEGYRVEGSVMPEIRPARPARARSKSLESLSASMNRALAGARTPQAAQARQTRRGAKAQPPAAARRAAARAAIVQARRRAHVLFGTLDALRRGAAG